MRRTSVPPALTWKYADMKVLSTTTTMSLLCSWTSSEQALMSTTFIVGLVGVSIHTSCSKKERERTSFDCSSVLGKAMWQLVRYSHHTKC